MLHFISFGSGSSGNCYYLFTEQGGVFIDVGIGVRMLRGYFDRYGLSLSCAQAILVTHNHADHVKSVGSLSHEYNLPVYATEKVHHGIDTNFVVKHKVEIGRRKTLVAGETIDICGMQITPITVPHDSCDNVGYRIQHGDVVFALMTDAGHVTDQMASLISESNYLVLESNHEVKMLLDGKYPQYLKERILSDTGHLSNTDCGLALRDHGTPALKHVWLCHISQDNNTIDLARYTVQGILRDSGIVVGRDFDLDVLDRKKPSLLYELTL